MLTIYDSHHIPTNRCLPGHRACRSCSDFNQRAGEVQRVMRESIAVINRRLRFDWLVGQWKWHEEMTSSHKEGRCR